MGISDHREGLTPTGLAARKQQADAANASGEVIAGCGYEMGMTELDGSTELGHLNALFTGKFMHKPLGLEALYGELKSCDPCVGQWNHPPGAGDLRGLQGLRERHGGDAAHRAQRPRAEGPRVRARRGPAGP